MKKDKRKHGSKVKLDPIQQQAASFFENLKEILDGAPFDRLLTEPPGAVHPEHKILGTVEDLMAKQLYTYMCALIDQLNDMPEPRTIAAKSIYDECQLQLRLQIQSVRELVLQRIQKSVPNLPPSKDWEVREKWTVVLSRPEPAKERVLLFNPK